MSTISPLGTSTSGATPTPPPATTGNGLGTDDFLKLLIAQLKNQDPMNPASGTEFIAQTAQFTAVEKLNQLSQQYTELINTQKATEATALIGRTIGYADDNGNPAVGVVSSVRLAAGGPVLRVGLTDVPLAGVLSVGN